MPFPVEATPYRAISCLPANAAMTRSKTKTLANGCLEKANIDLMPIRSLGYKPRSRHIKTNFPINPKNSTQS